MDELRNALRRLAKAVAIITAQSGDRRYAMAATAVTEVSFDPPSMLVCINSAASLYPLLTEGAPFGINILHHSQRHIADRCAGGARGEDRFQEAEWRSGALDVPYLVGAQATIVCRSAKALRHGTHGIFIGDVVEVRTAGDPQPLIYLDGRYTDARSASEFMSANV